MLWANREGSDFTGVGTVHQVTLVSGQTVHETVDLAGSASLEGVVTATNREPGYRLCVQVYPGQVSQFDVDELAEFGRPANLEAFVRAGRDGRFRIPDLSPGTHTVVGILQPARQGGTRRTDGLRYTNTVVLLAEGQTANVSLTVP